MSIAVLISGYFRNFETTVYNLDQYIFSKYNCDIFVHYSSNINDKKYDNYDVGIGYLKTKLKPVNILYSDNIAFTNDAKKNDILNQNYKIYLLNENKNIHEKIIKTKYKAVLRIRPDVYLNDYIDFNTIKSNTLYVPNDSKIDKARLTNKNENNICDMIAYGDSNVMNKYCNFFLHTGDLIETYGCVNETLLWYYLYNNNIEVVQIMINYGVILSTCNTIAISGNSGSGKSTIAKILEKNFKNSVLLECDRYHKWERGDLNWKSMTHLNPEANLLTKMRKDVFDLKIGNNIYQVDYDHKSGKFTNKNLIESKENIIVCGLHSLYLDKNITNLRIYMDTHDDLCTYWKMNRDIKKRGYTKESIYDQIKHRKSDYLNYIKLQKQKADLIINIYSENYTFNLDTFENETDHILKFRIGINKKYNVQHVVTFLENINHVNEDNFVYLLFNSIDVLESKILEILKILKQF